MEKELGVRKTTILNKVYDELMKISKGGNSYNIEEIKEDKRKYAESFMIQYENTDAFTAKPLIEEYPHGVFIVQNPPSKPLSQMELDDIYRYPYMRTYHPSYQEKGGVPAIEEIRFSLTS